MKGLRQRRRVVSLCAVLILGAEAISACGNDDGSEANEAADTTTTAEPTTETAESTTETAEPTTTSTSRDSEDMVGVTTGRYSFGADNRVLIEVTLDDGSKASLPMRASDFMETWPGADYPEAKTRVVLEREQGELWITGPAD